eukprot:364811-Chlamydomonas_euryale.AAC.6
MQTPMERGRGGDGKRVLTAIERGRRLAAANKASNGVGQLVRQLNRSTWQAAAFTWSMHVPRSRVFPKQAICVGNRQGSSPGHMQSQGREPAYLRIPGHEPSPRSALLIGLTR